MLLERNSHTAFNGETLLKKIYKSWYKEQEVRIFLKQNYATKLRIKHNQKFSVSFAKSHFTIDTIALTLTDRGDGA